MRKVFTNISQLHYGTINLFPTGSIGYSINDIRLKPSHKHHAMVLLDPNQDPQGIINRTTYVYCPKRDDNLVYLEPKARNSRDMVRNSGYKITLDRDKANFIVIPPLEDYQISYFNTDVVVHDTDTDEVYMFSIKNNYCSEITEDIKNKISDKLFSVIGPNCKFYSFTKELNRGRVYFIPNIQTYLDIISGSTKPCIFDRDLDYDALYNINVETLELWRHMTDDTILEKCIIGSDWKKYPFTLNTFIDTERSCRGLSGSQNKNLRMILSEIGSGYDWSPTRQIEPEDWNMCQRWIMHLLGVDENKGGYIDEDRIDALSCNYREILRNRFLVAPFIINHPMDYDNLKANL